MGISPRQRLMNAISLWNIFASRIARQLYHTVSVNIFSFFAISISLKNPIKPLLHPMWSIPFHTVLWCHVHQYISILSEVASTILTILAQSSVALFKLSLLLKTWAPLARSKSTVSTEPRTALHRHSTTRDLRLDVYSSIHQKLENFQLFTHKGRNSRTISYSVTKPILRLADHHWLVHSLFQYCLSVNLLSLHATAV